jgi:Mg/Co/Ni transporter MgtE
MDDENVKSIVNSAISDNPVEMKNAFYNAINDRIFSAIEQRKQEIAKNLIGYNEDDSEEDTDTDMEVETETETETEE